MRDVLAVFLFLVCARALFMAMDGSVTLKREEGELINDWSSYSDTARDILIHNIGLDFPDLSEDERAAYGDCVVERMIPVYNASGCLYFYNSLREKEADHLEKQEQCLEETHTNDKIDKITFNCLADSLGTSWRVDRERLFRQMRNEGGLDKIEIKTIARDAIAYCLADGMIPLLDKSGCSPFEGYSMRDGYSDNPCYKAFVQKESTREATSKLWDHCIDPETHAKRPLPPQDP